MRNRLTELAVGLCLLGLGACLFILVSRGPGQHVALAPTNIQATEAPAQALAQPILIGEAMGMAGVPSFRVLRLPEGDHISHPGGKGLYLLEPNYTLPAPTTDYIGVNVSCYDIAQKTVQPYTEVYKRRHRPPEPLPGGVPRSFFRWDGNITREEFDAVPPPTRGPDCVYCDQTVRYQVINGYLYRKGPPRDWLVQVAEDVMLAAIHMWDVPDVDFILFIGDSCPTGIPVMGWNVCSHKPKAGWAFPSYTAWMHALGPQQLQVYYQCMANRYPMAARKSKVLWRGSTTDPAHHHFKIGVVDKVTRMNIHKQFKNHQLIDAKLSRIINGEPCVHQYLGELAPKMELEDFNTAAIIMDMDGNGWSDRLNRLMHFPTPILKQASHHTAFFEHLLAEGHLVDFFDNDTGNLEERGLALLAEWQKSPERMINEIQRRQGLALAFLNNAAVAEAAAYALLEYSKKLTWKVIKDPSYQHVPFSQACRPNQQHLPAAVCNEIRARLAPT